MAAISEIIFSETRGAFSSTKYYLQSKDSTTNNVEILHELDDKGSTTNAEQKNNNNKWFIQNFLITIRQIFLPSGYPESVSQDYLEYQLWDTVQAFSSSITGALATEAVMKGVGVGDENASTLAATMTWLIRSGSGMIGQILFAWAKGTALDHDNKKWRLFADVLNDLATFIDLITPLFPPSIIVLMFCCSSISRAIVGVAGGGTRVAIIQHQSRLNNLADVSAKDGSQETLVNLISLFVSLALLPAVSGKTTLVWILFTIFTCLHIYSNYRAVKSLKLEAFNKARLLMCIKQYLNDGRVPSVKTVNWNENVIIGFGIKDVDVCQFHIQMGVSMEEALANTSDPDQSKKSCSKSTILDLINSSNGKSFLIVPNKKKKIIQIVLQENISSSDIIEAYTRAVLSAFAFSKGEKDDLDAFDDSITEEWEIFRNCTIVAGFNCSIALLETGDWRAKWKKHL